MTDKQIMEQVEKAMELGYQQGRADKYREITSEYMLMTEKQVAEIRADAIEEYVSILKKELDFCEKHGDLVVKLAEQLKENINAE